MFLIWPMISKSIPRHVIAAFGLSGRQPNGSGDNPRRASVFCERGNRCGRSDHSGDGFIGLLCRYLLERECRDTSPIARVFDCDAADVALSINIQERVFVEVSCLGDFSRSKLDIQRISVLEIFYFHRLNDLSKNALWTASPSDKSITRRYFPSISGSCAQRPTRPWDTGRAAQVPPRRRPAMDPATKVNRFHLANDDNMPSIAATLMATTRH